MGDALPHRRRRGDGERATSSRPKPRGRGRGNDRCRRQVPGSGAGSRGDGRAGAAAHLSPPAGAAGRQAGRASGRAGGGGAGPGRTGAATGRPSSGCTLGGRPGSPSVSDAGAERALRGCGRRAGTTPLYRVGNSRSAPLPLTQRRPAPHDYAAVYGAGPALRTPIGCCPLRSTRPRPRAAQPRPTSESPASDQPRL